MNQDKEIPIDTPEIKSDFTLNQIWCYMISYDKIRQKSGHVPYSFWAIPFCVMSVFLLFGALLAFCEASGEKPNRLEHLASDADGGKTMRVLWTISAYHIGRNATWGKTKAENMLFKPLDINRSSITFNGETCHDVIFKREIVNAQQYLGERYQATSQILNYNENTLEVIKTNCRLPGFSEYMRLRDRRLIVQINGVLFIFDPMVNY